MRDQAESASARQDRTTPLHRSYRWAAIGVALCLTHAATAVVFAFIGLSDLCPGSKLTKLAVNEPDEDQVLDPQKQNNQLPRQSLLAARKGAPSMDLSS